MEQHVRHGHPIQVALAALWSSLRFPERKFRDVEQKHNRARYGLPGRWRFVAASLFFLPEVGRVAAGIDERRNLPHSYYLRYGGVLVSTLQVRQRRHVEDGSLASLITRTKR